MDPTGNPFDSIAGTVAALVTVALALSAALGNTVMMLTEAIKSAFRTKPGHGGLIAILVSIFLSMLAAVLTARFATDAAGVDYLGALAVGLFIGLIVGGGAINSHKAAGTVNVETSADIAAGNDFRNPPVPRMFNFESSRPVQLRETGSTLAAVNHGDSFDIEPETDDNDDGDDLDAIIAAGPKEGDYCDCTPDVAAEDEKPNVSPPAITFGSHAA